MTVFLTLVGTAGASALWTVPATTLGKVSASAGTVAIAQSGFSSLAVDYNATVRATTKTVTITNTGQLAAPYVLTLGVTASNALATGVLVNTWLLGTPFVCNANVAVATGATSSNWTNIPQLTGTLAAGSSASYCVRTAITAPQQVSLAGLSIAGTLSLSSSVGTWSASTTATATQKVIDTTPPSAPGKPVASGTTGTRTTLAWATSTDNVGVVAYDIYRGGTLVGSSTTLSFTDTGLAPLTAYSYTIKARDAAGNASAASAATSVTTASTAPIANLWYKIVNPASGLCLDGNEEFTAAGTAVIVFGCHGGTNQTWKFQSDGTILAKYAPLYMYATGAGNNAGIALGVFEQSRNSWTVVPVGTTGEFQIKNSSSGRCIDVGTPAAALNQVAQRNCSDTSVAQRFTMIEMG